MFTHGFALNLDSWHFQRAALRGHYRLVFWDQRGHGRSATGPRGSSTIETIGHDLARVIDAVAPEGPLVLVGHSMGGMTIMSLAEHRPELFADRVVATAFIGTSAGGLAEVPWTRNRVVSQVVHRVAPGAVSTLARRPELVSRTRRLGSDLEEMLVRRYSFASPVPPSLVRFAADMIAATRIEVVADFLPTFDLHDAREALAALADTEVLILGGAQDSMTPSDHSDELAVLLPARRARRGAGRRAPGDARAPGGRRPGAVRPDRAGPGPGVGLSSGSARPSPYGRRARRRPPPPAPAGPGMSAAAGRRCVGVASGRVTVATEPDMVAARPRARGRAAGRRPGRAHRRPGRRQDHADPRRRRGARASAAPSPPRPSSSRGSTRRSGRPPLVHVDAYRLGSLARSTTSTSTRHRRTR